MGPSPRMLVANTVINMPVPITLEHVDDKISNMWLHCPLIHVKAEIVIRSHALSVAESE